MSSHSWGVLTLRNGIAPDQDHALNCHSKHWIAATHLCVNGTADTAIRHACASNRAPLGSATLEQPRISRKKLEDPNRVETASKGTSDSRRLHIQDIKSGLTFLVDTGTDILLIPVDKVKNRKLFKLKLRLTILVFKWNFCVAAIFYLIIEADFLNHYGLLVDLRRAWLIDPVTNLFLPGIV